MTKNLYTAHAVTTAGRDGHTKTDDGRIDMKLSRPGGSEPGTNPEQLFACGYSACFGSAVAAIAKKKEMKVGEVKIKADVSLNQDESGGFFIAVVLDAELSGIDDKQAEELVKDAHKICPYSKATRGNIDVKLKIKGRLIN